MNTLARLSALGLLLAAGTWFFGSRFVVGIERMSGERAYLESRFSEAWRHYEAARRWGADPGQIETDEAELLLFGLDQQELGLKIKLPLPERAASERTTRYIARRLRAEPYRAYLWSLASDLYFRKGRIERRTKPLDLSTLSDNPAENLSVEEGLGVACLREASRREPGNYIYQDLLAEAFLDWGMIDQAAASVREAVALYPKLDGHIYLSRSSLQPRILKGALAGFDAALERESVLPRDAIECDAGRLLLSQGMDRDAVPYFERARRDNPHNPDPPYRLGIALYRLEKYRPAVAILQEASGKIPKSPFLWYYLGLAQLRTGQVDAAVGSLRRAREIDPTNVQFFHALAEVLERGPHLKEAERQYQAAAYLNPHSTRAWSALLDFYGRHPELHGAARQACEHLPRTGIDPKVYEDLCDQILRRGT